MKRPTPRRSRRYPDVEELWVAEEALRKAEDDLEEMCREADEWIDGLQRQLEVQREWAHTCERYASTCRERADDRASIMDRIWLAFEHATLRAEDSRRDAARSVESLERQLAQARWETVANVEAIRLEFTRCVVAPARGHGTATS